MQNESNRIEYKEILNDKLERSVISFLNTQIGGRLYIGVNDKGVPVGAKEIDDTQKRIIDRIKNNVQPNALGLFDVAVEEIEGVEVICVIVSSGSEKPYEKRIDEPNTELITEPNTELPELDITETGQKILDLIEKNSKITMLEIADKLNITKRGVEKSVKALKESNVIERIGNNRSGNWKILV